MSIRHLLFCCLLLAISPAYSQLSGHVIDSKTQKPLAFVNMISNTEIGATTDIDGYFNFQNTTPITSVELSYIGYENTHYEITSTGEQTIAMEPRAYELTQFEFVAGVNPALRIIRNCINNRKQNNPLRLESFEYEAYNKVDYLSSLPADSVKDPEFKKVIESQNFLTMEFVSERKYAGPGKDHEVVIGSKVSGLKDPPFTLLASQLQSFSIYEDFISIMEIKFISPVTSGSINKYVYVLKDTIVNGSDTTYSIYYQPKKGTNFKGVKGRLSISTDQWAVVNFTAEPNEVNEQLGDVRIQHQYVKIGDRWFPNQLNADIIYSTLNLQGAGNLKAVHKSYLRKVKINQPLDDHKFTNISLETADEATRQDSTFWEAKREKQLTAKDSVTYQQMDSIGQAEKFDFKLKAMLSLANGGIPIKFVDLKYDKLVSYNRFEGFRFGAGLYTNNKLSKHFSIGGYGGYGLKDEAIKYGFSGEVYFDKRRQWTLKASHEYDVQETGGTSFAFKQANYRSSEMYRDYLVRQMDYLKTSKVSLNMAPTKWMKTQIGGQVFHRTAYDNYSHSRKTFYPSLSTPESLHSSEVFLSGRIAFREKFVKSVFGEFSLGTASPIFFFNVKKSVNNPWFVNEVDYTKVDFRMIKNFETKFYGTTHLSVEAGKIWGDTPSLIQYYAKGNYLKNGIVADNTFETMAFNEFINDEYVVVSLKHSFNGLLIKSGSFNPKISVVHHALFGRLNNSNSLFHKDASKGYFESGITADNVLVSGISGLGIGAFYRHGAYAHTEPMNNLFLKATATFAF